MIIEIELPDWPEEEGRGLYILAGIEPIAIKLPNQPWQVKTGRCSNCGKCCRDFKQETDIFPAFHVGVSSSLPVCDHLISDGPKWVCALGLNRPFICCTSTRKIEGCTVKYETIEA